MSLQVWLPLTGDLHNQGLADIDMSLASGNTFITTDSKIGHGSLTLTQRQLISSTAFNGKKQISWALWVKVNTAWSAQWLDGIYWITSDGSTTDANRQEFYTNCTKVGMWYKGGSISGYNFTPGVWTHLAGTVDYENGHAAFYINGIQQGSTTNNVDTTRYITSVYIGDSGIDVQENDVRIYDHILSKKEIEEISKGLVLHYKLDNITQPNLLSNNPNLVNAWVQDGITLTQENDNSLKCVVTNNSYKRIYNNVSNVWTTIGNTYTVSFLAKAQTNGTEVRASRSIADYAPTFTLTTNWEYYSAQITITATSTGGTLSIQGINNGDVFWLRNIKLENGNIATHYLLPNDTINIIYDSSGYQNNGTIVGSLEATTPSPRYSCAAKFDGSSYIKKTDFIYDSNIWSVNLWYLKPTNPTAYECLFSFSQGDGGDSNKKIAACPNSGRIWYKGESGSSSISQLKINEWTNLIMTCNGTTVTIYQNGNSIGTFSASTALTGRTDLVIGARASAENVANITIPYTGNLSDFRIYATALTAKQILELYHTSASIDNNGNIYARELVEE